jgi:starch synthase
MTSLAKKKLTKEIEKISKKTHLNIVFIAPEVAPFSKFGGLADVAWALPRSLKKLGHNVKIIMPKYASIDEKKFGIKRYKQGLRVKTKTKDIVCNVKIGKIPDDLEVYLVENMEYYELRANVYGYKDDATRFALLCRAAIQLIKDEEWPVDIVHANDWMTGFLPNYLKTEYKDDPALNKITTIFTIHNLALQGINTKQISPTKIDQGSGLLPDLLDDEMLFVNGMLRGIIYSDYVTTVSERYAKEILTPEFGEGLDKILQEMRNKLVGIRDGVDYEILSPEVDKNIYVNYSFDTIKDKVENKISFQREFDLDVDPDMPLVAFVGRFSEQKGLGLLHDTIRPLLDSLQFQFAVVGGAGEYWEKYFDKLIKEYPKRVAGYLMISTTFGQKLYAAADILVHPSKFEPCGIAHAIAMRFGTIPIVRETGGLADSVVDMNKYPRKGDGFMFKDYKDMEFLIQLVNAITTYKTNKREWKQIQKRAMSKDLSWDASALKYEDLYVKAIDRHDKWMKKEGIIMADYPLEVPGYSAIDILS